MKVYKIICLTLFMTVLLAALSQFNYAMALTDGKVFSQNREKSNMIALTFDDGPHPRYTPQILDILAEYNIKATFFVIGENIVNYPEAMKKLSESNCEIGNHTFSHDSIDNGKLKAIDEISRCENEILKFTDMETKLLRPPQGKMDSETISAANELDYNIILWSIDTLDWAHNPSKNIAKNVLSLVKGGDIILMHDYISGENSTCDALRIMIPQLIAKGYEFVTVSELIS